MDSCNIGTLLLPTCAVFEPLTPFVLQFEFARAVREGVKVLLREHLHPRLLAEGVTDAGLWTHFAAAAAAFERQLAPLRGVVSDAATLEEGEDELPGLAAAEGCLTVIFEVRPERAEATDAITEGAGRAASMCTPQSMTEIAQSRRNFSTRQDGEWQDAWLAAERAEAIDAITETLDGPQAWQPLDAGWASMDLDDEPGASPSSK